jgi:co-chaperonin GroES (HSP10)
MILVDEMVPTRDNIIVDRIAGEKETESGIILKTSEGPDRAKVIAIGPKIDEVEVGDEVLLNWNGAVKIANERYVIKIEHVVLIF